MDFEDYEHRLGYIRARLRLLTTEEGGRRSGVADDYYPNWGVGTEPSGKVLMTGARITIEGATRLELGETAIVRLQPTYWDAWQAVQPGAQITMLEGPRVVGVAEVLELAPR